jgi:sugar phosphate isomerase/epimerase
MTLNESGQPGVLKLSSQEGPMPGKSLNEKLDFMEKHGLVGFEPWGGKLWERVDSIKKALSNRNIKVSAICAGFDGAPASEWPDDRKRAMDSMKRILEAAGELQSTGLIFVPAFNGQSQAGVVSARFLTIEFLKEIAEHAEKCKCRMLLEPLNRGETWYVRQLADAAKICQEVNHPYICMMGDFYHMGHEEACDYGAFVTARKWLHHVHLASRPSRKQPGFDANDDFRPGFRALKDIGYQDYCSFECGCEGPAKGDGADEQNKLTEMPKAFEYLRKQWEEA